MLDAEIRSLIHRLEFTTRKVVSGPLLGNSRSMIKGSGFEFDQLRDYEPGDDIRFIDWKASMRSNKMLVRQYLEDRMRKVYIVVDVSASVQYSSGSVRRSDIVKQLAAMLAFVALHSKDSVGLILYTNEVELVIPPSSSRAHVFSLVHTLFTYTPRHRTTDSAAPLAYLSRLKSKRAIVCFISDFNDALDKQMVSLVARRHELLAFRCLDELELAFPPVGSLIVEDSETGRQEELDGSTGFNETLRAWHRKQKELLLSARVECLDIIAGKAFTGDLVRFLRQKTFV
ncbi:DUF58 domain-containing protein [Candidatus Dependentiae bacterium]|nr:DUF58 domain-containing protein [Candidatus Dependentiae bacterium]